MVNGAQFKPLAPRVFLDDGEALQGDQLRLPAALVERLGRTLPLQRGARVEVIHAGRLYEVELMRVSADGAEATVLAQRPTAPEPAPAITLCPAALPAQRFAGLIERATELGVARLRPVQTEGSPAVPQLRQRMARWRRLITEAAEQCRREQRPGIEAPVDLETLLAESAPAGGRRLVASLREGGRRVAAALAAGPWPREVAILVGPDGGFTAAEAAAQARGWQPVTLGARPLRPETAALVALVLVQEGLDGSAQPAR